MIWTREVSGYLATTKYRPQGFVPPKQVTKVGLELNFLLLNWKDEISKMDVSCWSLIDWMNRRGSWKL